MAIKTFAGAFVAITLATGAFAQDCTNPLNAGNAACIGFVTPQTAPVVGATNVATGFVPLGAGAVAPIALGVSAIIAVAAPKGSNNTTSTD